MVAKPDEIRPPPAGFLPFDRRGPFSEHNGPIFFRDGATPPVQGFWALRRHCNGLGIVHGGMLASFLDGLLGHTVSAHTGKIGVTIHLSVDYLAMARRGEWIEGEGRVTRAARDVVFAEARAHAGGEDLARATAIFKLMERRRG